MVTQVYLNPRSQSQLESMLKVSTTMRNLKSKPGLFCLTLWPPLKDFLLHPSLQMLPNKYNQCGGRADISSARIWLSFVKESSHTFSVVLIQVNCLLCIINFLLFSSLFLSPTFNHSFKGPLPRFHPPRCLLKVTAVRVRGMLFEAGTKKATHSRRLGIDKSLQFWQNQKPAS